MEAGPKEKDVGLIHYAKRYDAPLSDFLRQARIKSENQFLVLFDSIWKDYTYTGRSTGSYIVFYKGVPIDHLTHVPGPVAQDSAGIE